MHNLARQLVAAGCVFATGLVAGSSPRWFSEASAATNAPSSQVAPCTALDGSCSPLALADEYCNDGRSGVVVSKESCRIPGGAPISPEANDDLDYDPAWLADLKKLDFPVRGYPRIEKFIHYWTATPEGRRIFKGWLKRSGKYRYEVDKALASRHLPADLAALVFVESGFSPTAHSKAGASGLWQLMPKTARDYGLVVEKNYDERRSVSKSSEAAVDHLASLYAKLGSWELVLAAYDMGARALYKKMEKLEAVDFWTLSETEGALPKETLKYVPQILAFAVVLKNLDHFGYDTIKLDSPIVTGELDVPAGVPLSIVAEATGTSIARLRELNPEILRDFMPSSATVMHVPAGSVSRARVVLPHLLFDTDRDDSAPYDSNTPFWRRDGDDEGNKAWGRGEGGDSSEPLVPSPRTGTKSGKGGATTRGGREAPPPPPPPPSAKEKEELARASG